jgi:predicted DCC family thiol-disulfide oxidoreductase YuxK
MESGSVDGRQQRVLLFDGGCGLCTRVVQVVLRADTLGTLNFASLQGEFARGVLARHPELKDVDSMAWVETCREGRAERVFVRSEAVMRLARYLGFPWRLLAIARLVPARVRDRLYDWVARHRHEWFMGAATCSLPLAEHRGRFR